MTQLDIKRILIVDLEATCWNDRPQSVDVMEVVEFGCALASLDGTIEASFGQLVKPQINSELSEFCIELTGISQAMVNESPGYIEAVKRLDYMLKNLHFDVWGSWGQYDFNQLKVEKDRYGIAPKFTEIPHINIKAIWQSTKGHKKKAGLRKALAFLGFEFEGNQHRGEDDAKNIAKVLPYLESEHLQNAALSKL
jgi:inhibitor of KinA sporulation pathway (predicted exonuclease)